MKNLIKKPIIHFLEWLAHQIYPHYPTIEQLKNTKK